jgi:hypothetical protein
LSFEHITGVHDGANLGRAIYNILDSYSIVEKLFCITTDNAGNNKTSLEVLQDLIWQHKGIKWDYKTHHIRCMNHCINLGVQVFLKTCKVLKDVEGVDDEDLTPLEEDDEAPTAEEEEERRAATRVRGNATFRKDVEAAAEGFQSTMWKLRETAKVYPSYVTHKLGIMLVNKSDLCATKLQVFERPTNM